MRTHQLETTLRALKMSGMLETLEARLAQAGAGELGYVEFLQALCEDEVARRDAVGIARRCEQLTSSRSVFSRTLTSPSTEDPRCPHQGPGDAALCRCRGVGHPARAGRSGKDDDRPGPRPPCLPPRLQRHFHQSQQIAGRSRRRPCRSDLGDAPSTLGATGRPGHRRLCYEGLFTESVRRPV